MPPLVEIGDLRIPSGATQVVRGIDLALEESAVLGLVGESGSGKSNRTFRFPAFCPPAVQLSGQILYEGPSLTGGSSSDLVDLLQQDSGTLGRHGALYLA